MMLYTFGPAVAQVVAERVLVLRNVRGDEEVGHLTANEGVALPVGSTGQARVFRADCGGRNGARWGVWATQAALWGA